MIHFALLGSIERFLSVYIEHTGGAFPVWLSPVQAVVIPISDKISGYAQEIVQKLNSSGIRVQLDDRSERMQAKIRDAEAQKIPYILVVGDREIKDKSVNVRVRGEKILGSMPVNKFTELIVQDIAKKRIVC